MKKEYIAYNQSGGHPVGVDLYYECVRCEGPIASLADDPESCPCGNLIKDIGRIGCSEGGDEAMRLVRITAANRVKR